MSTYRVASRSVLLGFGGIGMGVLVGFAACAPGQSFSPNGDVVESSAPANGSALSEAERDTIPQPSFTPFDEAPELLNDGEYVDALDAAYSAIENSGMEGMVRLWVFIDGQGFVPYTHIARSSGHEVLDELAVRIMESIPRFRPAILDEEPAAVWVSLPVTFPAR